VGLLGSIQNKIYGGDSSRTLKLTHPTLGSISFDWRDLKGIPFALDCTKNGARLQPLVQTVNLELVDDADYADAPYFGTGKTKEEKLATLYIFALDQDATGIEASHPILESIGFELCSITNIKGEPVSGKIPVTLVLTQIEPAQDAQDKQNPPVVKDGTVTTTPKAKALGASVTPKNRVLDYIESLLGQIP